MLPEDVTFWFSGGSHSGLEAGKRAFEAIWARIAGECYRLEDMRWLTVGDVSAACSYRFCWRGVIEDRPAEGTGRGTTVLRREPGGWVIVHEHLSAMP